MSGIVLSLCDRTGNMVKPWLDAGRGGAVDLQAPAGVHRDGLRVTVGADVCRWLPPLRDYEIVFAFPPCTDLAVSGARWFRDKGLAAFIQGLTVVERCREIAEWTGAPYMIENPVSSLSSYWRPPDHIFDPCDFGGLEPADDYTKRTCLWTGNGFTMPDHDPIDPARGSAMHLLPPSADRADLRSVTPMGFARAVFAANNERRDLFGAAS